MTASDPSPAKGTKVSAEQSDKQIVRNRALQSPLQLLRDRVEKLARRLDEYDDETIVAELDEAAIEAVALRDMVAAWSAREDPSMTTITMDVPGEMDEWVGDRVDPDVDEGEPPERSDDGGVPGE